MKELQAKITEIIKEAGKIMLSAGAVEENGSVNDKQGNCANMVTYYDVSVQNYLITEIKRLLPGAYFFAEEKDNDAEYLSAEHCFIIDPIDGTANFVHGYGISCISVAMLCRGVPTLAFVYDPYKNEIFYAEAGGGTYVNGKRVYASSRDMEHSIVAFGSSPYYKSELGEITFRLCKTLFSRCSDIRRCGSAALDLAYLAAGRCDIFFEARLSPWDFAAGWLLIREAGGVITDFSGKEIYLGAPTPVLASNAKNAQTVLEIVKNI